MSAPNQNVCSAWATSADVTLLVNPTATIASDVLTASLLAASNILFKLTRRRYPGICRETVRPCGQGCLHGYGFLGYSCGCGGLPTIVLPSTPVVNIVSVKVDGATVPTDEYRVDWYRDLVGITGASGVQRSWYCSQRQDLASSAQGTFEVIYDYGLLPGQDGILAAASLGVQLALGATAATVGECRLPQRITSITRQGVTLAVLDPQTLFPEGRTGLPEVDLFIASELKGISDRPGTAYRIGSGRYARRCC